MEKFPRFIGVVHLPAMPGDPGYGGSGGFGAVRDFALRDAEALVQGGVDGLIVENFGSAPFVKGTDQQRVAPHQLAQMTLVAGQLAQCFPEVALGVNCLRNDAHSALGIAAAAGLDLVRVNVHTGAMVTDQGLIEGEAHATVRYRQSLDAASVKIFADVLVKHAAPLAPLTAAQATGDCVLRGKADAVIVTGAATGAPIQAELLHDVQASAADAPVYLGSGVTPERAAELLPLAHGAIVGTWLKVDGKVHNPVDPSRVQELAAAISQLTL